MSSPFIYLVLIIVFSIFIITSFHESIHAAFYLIYGGKIKLGFKKCCVYTQEISSKSIASHKFIIILLAPAIIISITSLLVPLIGLFLLCINLIGCSGDFYMSFLVLNFNEDSKIIDRSYGFDVV